MTARDDFPLLFPRNTYAGPMIERMHDEIDRLRAENARLKALVDFALEHGDAT